MSQELECGWCNGKQDGSHQCVQCGKSGYLESPNQLVKVTVWYSVANGGDGSAYPFFFLTEEEAEQDQADICFC